MIHFSRNGKKVKAKCVRLWLVGKHGEEGRVRPPLITQ